MWPGPQPIAIPMNFYSCGVLTHDTIEKKPMVVSVQSATTTWFCVRPTSKRWFLKIIQVTMSTIHLTWCRNPCKLYIHHAFRYSVSPSSVMWSELGPALPFLPTRVLEVWWSRELSLVCEVALRDWSYRTVLSSFKIVMDRHAHILGLKHLPTS